MFDKEKDFPGQCIDIKKLLAYELSNQYFHEHIAKIKSDWWMRDIFASYYSYFNIDTDKVILCHDY